MKPREEAKAAALWAFIERIREEDEAVVDGLSGLTPGEVEQLARLLQTAAGLRRAFNKQGAEVVTNTPEEFRRLVEAEIQSTQKVVKATDLKVE